MKRAFIISGIFCCSHAFAQSGITVEYDINPGGIGSRPHNLYLHNGKVYFFATDTVHGYSLWSIDNSSAPSMAADVNPATVSFPSVIPQQQLIASYNGKLFFSAVHVDYGQELWMYDGANAPIMIKDMIAGQNSGSPTYLTSFNNRLYFAASDSTTPSGAELFEYNHLNGQVVKRSDILQAKLYSGITSVSNFDGRIVFTAFNDLTGAEVFLYDPNVKQSWMLSNIAPDNLDAYPGNYTVLNGKLYFTATDGQNGMQLYIYDGIYAPNRISALDSAGIHPSGLEGIMTVFNNQLYFSTAQNTIHAYNPITGTISDVKHNTESYTTLPHYFVVNKNKLYFSATGNLSGSEIWSCDTMNNINAITNMPDDNSFPAELICIVNSIYFSAGGINGRELYKVTDSATTIRTLTANTEVALYPNPAKDIAHLEINLKQNQVLEVTLTDMSGRIVYRSGKVLYSAAKHTIDIPLQNLPAGNYVYSLQDVSGNLVATGTLVKQ